MSISAEDIERVREKSDIVALFADRHQLKQRGRTFWCCCPFHNEKTPSLQIDPSNQLYYCFGCHAGGDIFNYVMRQEGMEFPDAVKFVAERFGVEITESAYERRDRGLKSRLLDICAATEEFYHTQLMRLKSPDADAARAYLSQRGLGGDIPKRWQLGFAPGQGALVSHLRSLGYTPRDMVEANVAVERSGRVSDRFYNRVMFPIHDERGAAIAFGGRVIGEGEPKYLNSRETPLFHKSRILFGFDVAKESLVSTGEAIVVEGYTDVIALHEAGFTNAVATLGTALSAKHIQLISRFASKRIVYLFDGDEAGQRAIDRALEFIGESMTPEAGTRKIDLLACTLPDNLDPAEFLAAHAPADLRREFDAAKPLIQFGIDRRLARYNLDTAEGRARAFDDALSILAPIKTSLLAKDYAAQLADTLRLRLEDAQSALANLKTPRRLDEAVSESSSPADPRVETPRENVSVALSQQEQNRRKIEAELLGLCARHPRATLGHLDAISVLTWHAGMCKHAFEMLLDNLAENPEMESSALCTQIVSKYPKLARYVITPEDETLIEATQKMAFLIEELELGDEEDAIETLRATLKSQTLSDEEQDLMFQTVAKMQQELTEKKTLHAKRKAF